MTIKTVWHVKIDGHVGYSLYTADIVRATCSEYAGRVTEVRVQTQDWSGDHDRGDRAFYVISDRDVTAEYVSEREGY